MKGQAVQAGVVTIAVVIILLLLGFIIQGYVFEATPHDKLYVNESICTTTCSNYTTLNYTLDHPPVQLGYTGTPVVNLTCYNDTNQSLTYGDLHTWVGNYILAPNGKDDTIVIINNTDVHPQNVVCTYVYDAWRSQGAAPQTWFTTMVSNVGASYALASIVAVVLAAVLIIGAIFLLGKKG